MIVECPHCFRRVIPRSDGICPSCRGDTRSAPLGGSDQTKILVKDNSQLPWLCCSCASPTRRIVRIASTLRQNDAPRIEEGGDRLPLFLLSQLVGSVLALVFRAMFRPSPAASQVEIAVAMRQCKRCTKERGLQPIFIDYNYFAMQFVVHREFADEFDRMNGSAPT